MKILFWNLNNNSNEKWVAEIIREKDVDIAIFAEYQSTSFENVLSDLDNIYNWHDGFGGCEKVTLLCKNNIKTVVRREQNRYTVYSCSAGDFTYNVVGLHLPAPPSSDANTRKLVIRDIVCDINEQEKASNNRCTIVIGDFNCNPFDEEIIQKDSFNAVLYKQLINKQEAVIFGGKKFRRFYNPIIHFLSEDTNTYGSLYYSSGSASLYWNSFDQILVRKGLVDSIESFAYLKTINGKSLLEDVKPKAAISDHLPLLVSIMKG